MKTGLLLLFGLGLIAIAILMVAKAKAKGFGGSAKGTFTKRPLATANEQGMFWRLVECFPQPEYVVLTQVSFGALLNARGGASRYSFSQKRADFVLADKTFKVITVIELDDSSHRGKEERDGKRDAMLQQAGYKVVRYARTPDRAKLLEDLRGND